MAPSFDTAGTFAREAEILRKATRVLLDDEMAPAAVSRVMLAQDLFDAADPIIGHAARNAMMRLSARLPALERINIAHGRSSDWREAFRLIQGAELQRTLLPVIRKFGLCLGPGIKERFDMAEAITEDEAAAAQDLRKDIRAHMAGIVKPGAVIALPTTPTLAPLAGTPDGEAHAAFRARTLEFTCIASLAGLPQISIPAGETEGCPVGLSVIGWPGGDEALLGLAAELAGTNSR
jgi:amidase